MFGCCFVVCNLTNKRIVDGHKMPRVKLTQEQAKKKANEVHSRSPTNTICCMCYKEVSMMPPDDQENADTVFTPGSCITPTRYIRGHKICRNCWFGVRVLFGREQTSPKTVYGEIPFATENRSHTCPGCKVSLPVNERFLRPDVIELD